jgi:hypothetical protein
MFSNHHICVEPRSIDGYQLKYRIAAAITFQQKQQQTVPDEERALKYSAVSFDNGADISAGIVRYTG